MANNEATEFRQFLSNNPFVIQKGLDSFIVTNFAPDTKKYNVLKRKYGYKIQKLKSGAQPVEFYIPVISWPFRRNLRVAVCKNGRNY